MPWLLNSWRATKGFIVRNKIISLILFSLLGGIPGIINIWDWTHDEPKFNFYAESMSGGVIDSKEWGRFQYIVIGGAIYNNGNKPFFPTNFKLNLFFHDTLISIGAQPLDTARFNRIALTKGSVNLKFRNSTDLLQIPRVNPMDASYGILFFPINFFLFQLQGFTRMQLVCRDITLKEWEYELDFKRLTPVSRSYPRSGVDLQQP